MTKPITYPSHFKLRGNTSKFILKEVAKELLPNEIIHRPKQTFNVPIAKWLNSSLKDLTLDLISQSILQGQKFSNEKYVLGEMWQGLEEHREGYARQFWSLLNLGLRARHFDVLIA